MSDNGRGTSDAVRELTGKVGQLTGEFKGLKEYIKLQTDGCRANYEALNNSFTDVRKKLNGRIVADDVRSGFRKIMESRATLICTIIMAAVAVITTKEMWSKNKNDKESQVSASADVGEEIEKLTDVINSLERRLGETEK